MKQLKSEPAALDRKITAELAPKHDDKEDNTVVEQDGNMLKTTISSSECSKNNLLAEPVIQYRHNQ